MFHVRICYCRDVSLIFLKNSPAPFLRLLNQAGSYATGSKAPEMMTMDAAEKNLVELRGCLRVYLKQQREGDPCKSRAQAQAQLATVAAACTLQSVLGLSPGCVLPALPNKVG